jgi:Rrf2 family transcriptional regulator, iron-sulfur cluster assembly transcription factor
MINISKTAKYALQGLLYLARNNEKGLIKIDEVSKVESIPTNYLRKIFQQLIKNNIVESSLGPKGGVRLQPGSGQVSLAKVISIFDGEPNFQECSLFGSSGCPSLANCPLHGECHSYDQNVWDKLRKYRLDDMLNEKSCLPIVPG